MGFWEEVVVARRVDRVFMGSYWSTPRGRSGGRLGRYGFFGVGGCY
jgi:hypothetical protein